MVARLPGGAFGGNVLPLPRLLHVRAPHWYGCCIGLTLRFARSEMATPYEHQLKLLLIGDSSVGKSSILLRFTDDVFSDKQAATIGVDFKTADMNWRGKQIRGGCFCFCRCYAIALLRRGAARVAVTVWDTAGQEKVRPAVVLSSVLHLSAVAVSLVDVVILSRHARHCGGVRCDESRLVQVSAAALRDDKLITSDG